MSTFMSFLMFGFGLSSIVALIWMLVRIIKKRPFKKQGLYCLSFFIATIIAAIVMTASMTPEEKAALAERQAKKQAIELAEKEASEKAALEKALTKKESSEKSAAIIQKHTIEENNTEKDDLQKEKDAFSAWYINLQSELNKVDKDWETWEKTFTALGNGSIDRYQAYANIKALSTAMYNHHANLKDYSITKDLSKDRQKTLKEAIDNLSMWAYYRHNACDSVNELIDNNNFKPSELDKIKAKIESGDRLMFKGLAMTTQVQSELGLLEQTDQK